MSGTILSTEDKKMNETISLQEEEEFRVFPISADGVIIYLVAQATNLGIIPFFFSF